MESLTPDTPAKTREVLEGEYYSNILLVSIKNTPLTTISEKRANWYVERDLAEDLPHPAVLERFPRYKRVVKLKFKAKLEDKLDPFYQQIIETQCVVCGKRHGLTVHHVVPSAIRKWFPDEHKNHSHGWCVLLCEKHHAEADDLAMEVHAAELKQLDQKILAESKRIKAEWAAEFIARNGGIEQVKEIYRNKFKVLDPKHLPDGFLEDHSLREFPMPENEPVEIDLTKEE